MTENDLIGFLKAGKYRIKILKILEESQIIPNEIAKRLGVNPSQVSRTLSELKKVDLIICKTPTRIKGRIYKVSKKGFHTLKLLGEN